MNLVLALCGVGLFTTAEGKGRLCALLRINQLMNDDFFLREKVANISGDFQDIIRYQRRNLPFLRSPAHWDVLAFFVGNFSTPSVKNIAFQANIDSKTAKRILSEFEDAGLIEYVENYDDRRFKRYYLTTEGLRVILSYWSALRSNPQPTGDKETR